MARDNRETFPKDDGRPVVLAPGRPSMRRTYVPGRACGSRKTARPHATTEFSTALRKRLGITADPEANNLVYVAPECRFN